MPLLQKTIRSKVLFSGKGLHSGTEVRMEVRPANAGTGILFKRTDTLSTAVEAHVLNVSSTQLSTTIGSGVSSVSTVEHLLAAFYGLGVDNAIVLLNGPEVPIMDGSALPFVEKLMRVGFKTLNEPRAVLKLKRPVELVVGEKRIVAEPATQFSLNCAIDFEDEVIGQQKVSFFGDLEGFLRLSRARTFCRLEDVALMKKSGLALGGSLDNAVVVSTDGVLNEGGLRDPMEFVYHKALDVFGDLTLLGSPLVAKVSVLRPGHDLHWRFMCELIKKKELYLETVHDERRYRHPNFLQNIRDVASGDLVGAV